MKHTIHKIYTYIALLAIGACLALQSCENKEDLGEAPRIFRPTSLSASVKEVNATLTWNAIPGTTSYTVEISADSLEFNHIINRYVVSGTSYTVEELAGGQLYSARVRSNSADMDHDSKYATVTFKVSPENIFKGYDMLTGTTEVQQLQVAWAPGKTVTKLEITPAGGSPIDYPINANEMASGMKVCSVPDNNSSYTIVIYNAGANRGTTTTFVEGNKFVHAGGDITAVLAGAVEGDVIVLDGAATFVHQRTLTLTNAGYTVKGGPGTSKTTLQFFNVEGSTCINHNNVNIATGLKFSNMTVQGALVDGDIVATNIAGKNDFLFNANVSGTLNNLIFENCTIEGFGRGLIRWRANSVINNLMFDGCIVRMHATSNYPIVSTENNAKFDNTTFRNSTIYSQNNTFYRHNSTVAATSLLVTACTINDFGKDGDYFARIDNGVLSTLTITNTIMGKTKGPINGMTAGKATLSITGSYKTSDYDDSKSVNNALADLMAYTKASTDLWMDPANGDFSFKDAGFSGAKTAGDPRWR